MNRKRHEHSRASDGNPLAASVERPVPLIVAALDQNQEVQEKIEAAADDLAVVNDSVKGKLAEGATMVSAEKVLADGEKVESEVQEAAADLLKVNETLSQGIDDLKDVESALTSAREELADAEAALAITKEEEKQARRRALHDARTGLPNRDLFDDRLAHAISLAERHDWTLAVMFLDLDQFKSINDTHGHAAGDQVLKEVAKRLLQHSRDEDTVCRNGGDEFLYLLMNPRGSRSVERIASAVAKNIAQPIDVGDAQIVINVSIGIALYPDNGTSGEQLIGNADAAMYRAKEGKTGCVFSDAARTETRAP